MRGCPNERDLDAFERGIMTDLVKNVLNMRKWPMLESVKDRFFRIGVSVSESKLYELGVKKES